MSSYFDDFSPLAEIEAQFKAQEAHREGCPAWPARSPCDECGLVACAGECGGVIQNPRNARRPYCQQCEATLARKARELEWARSCDATIPPYCAWATLTHRALRALIPRELLERAEKAVASGKNLLIQGPTGAGKTSLACALLRSVAPDRNRTFPAFINAKELAYSGWPKGSAEEENRMTAIGNDAATLVLDEIGQNGNSMLPQEIARISLVIETRFARRSSSLGRSQIIAISPIGRSQIIELFGPQIERRLTYGAVIIELPGRA